MNRKKCTALDLLQHNYNNSFLPQVFDRIRSEMDAEKTFDKVVCVNGDVSDPELGLSAEDRQRLSDEVTIVFHSAATVKFNETLRTAVTLNTLGTQRVVDLCRTMKKLKVILVTRHLYGTRIPHGPQTAVIIRKRRKQYITS